MASQRVRIGTKDGLRCLDGWGGPMGVKRELKNREEYEKKSALAVHNRLIMEGNYEELATLHKEFGKPKEIVSFEAYENDIADELSEDLERLRQAFLNINDYALQQAQNINLLLSNLGGSKHGRN